MIQRRPRVLEPLPLLIVRSGQTLLRQGEPCAGWFRVEAGALRVSSVEREGRELVLDVAGPGDVVGGHAGGSAAWTVRALGPGRLRASPDGPDTTAARLPGLLHLLAWHDVETRLERRLADLAARFGHEVSDGVAIGLRISQDELAAMIGCTRESANRALGRIVAAGRVAVVRRGRYVVRSPLRAVVSDDGPSAAPPSCSIVSMHELQ